MCVERGFGFEVKKAYLSGGPEVELLDIEKRYS
jgi:hypothetical protein